MLKKPLQDCSAWISNYKCFAEKPQGFDRIKNVNLIIGQNNSGKSSLLDLIESLTTKKPEFADKRFHKSNSPEIVLENVLDDTRIRRVFPETTSGGEITAINHFAFAKSMIGARIAWRHTTTERNGAAAARRFVSLSPGPKGDLPLDKLAVHVKNKYLAELAFAMSNPFEQYKFQRVVAERNITAEAFSASNIALDPNGSGATNLITNYLYSDKLDHLLIEVTLKDALNFVIGPELVVSRITSKNISDSRWEVFLEEELKGSIPLSESGSGLKTVILVLLNLLIVPLTSGDPGSILYAFEELENNLHPAVVRRLITFILDFSRQHGCHFFLTTHSSTAIDLLSTESDCQVVHVRHDRQSARCQVVTTYVDTHGLLDDLDIRASDLLQSNGVIWVEGPSDRIYLTRWIDIYTNGRLKEGLHYQCIFYGGRLLSHLSAADPAANDSGIKLLQANRHCCIVIDSDRKSKNAEINTTKQRLCREVEEINGIAWVTGGKEIENYISSEVLGKTLGIDSPRPVGQYESFKDYLSEIDVSQKSSYFQSKSSFAEEVAPLIGSREDLKCLDLVAMLEKICAEICSWNGLDPTSEFRYEPALVTDVLPAPAV